MTEDSYEEKEKLLRRKHELEWENFKARRDLESASQRGSILSGVIVPKIGPDPFEIEAAKLREKQSSELLALIEEKMAASSRTEAKLPDVQPPEVPLTRSEFVHKILEQKGWSILDWANEAGVSHATAIDYLQGKTKPYRSTRLKLAKALALPVGQLPK